MPISPKYSNFLVSLIDKCFTVDSKLRPSADELLKTFVVLSRPRKLSLGEENVMEPQCAEL